MLGRSFFQGRNDATALREKVRFQISGTQTCRWHGTKASKTTKQFLNKSETAPTLEQLSYFCNIRKSSNHVIMSKPKNCLNLTAKVTK